MALATYLDGKDLNGNDRLERNIKFLNYYLPLKKKMGISDFWIFDNCSSEENFETFISIFPELKVVRFDKHLIRHSIHDYPYCWRALYQWRPLIESGNYDRIVSIDSDAYILSPILLDWLCHKSIGWSALWCDEFQMPEAAVCALEKSKFDLFMGFSTIPWERYRGLILERTLPFTNIDRRFRSVRMDVNKNIEGADVLIQVPNDFRVKI